MGGEIMASEPTRYAGDGKISAGRAMRSMVAGWRRGEAVGPMTMWWVLCAFKYVWRFPLKGHPLADLAKAEDCIRHARAEMGEGPRTDVEARLAHWKRALEGGEGARRDGGTQGSDQ